MITCDQMGFLLLTFFKSFRVNVITNGNMNILWCSDFEYFQFSPHRRHVEISQGYYVKMESGQCIISALARYVRESHTKHFCYKAKADELFYQNMIRKGKFLR